MTMSQSTYVVVGSKPWSRRIFAERIARLPGRWRFIGARDELSIDVLGALKPRYIFFLHWSWKVPDEIVDDYDCICFHMTDVPFGRGGSPLQNLIVRGLRETKLTALRMSAQFDAGPVYLKRPLSLEGNAEEIYIRACELSASMIETIVRERPKPKAQRGTAVVFKRRQPAESELPTSGSLGALHDFIRMLDADGYPRAFLERGGFRYEFSRAHLYDGRIVADVTIRPLESESKR
jgi:methionyl-tRNA formyltransferase